MNPEDDKSELMLKWGTIKGWNNVSDEECHKLLDKYYEIGASVSVMMQRDTQEQKEIIYQLIDKVDLVYLSWDGIYVSKQEAKDYVKNYIKK